MSVRDKEQFASEFYSRQVVLNELGIEGQEILAKSKVAVIGVGGLGTVSSLYLALAGVGHLRLIDQDTVETRNLHRQILYNLDDLHYPKAEVAAGRLQKLNPLLEATPVSENINSSNVEKLLAGVNLVVDGLDNMFTRYLVNRACIKLGITYVFGAAIGFEGNISVFAPPETGCLECLMPNMSDKDLLTCDTRGVIGATPGIIGAMQAMEAIKSLTDIGSPLKGKLLVCDFNDMYFTTLDTSKASNCSACQNSISPLEGRGKIVWLCGQNTANINPEKQMKLSLNDVYQTVKKQFSVRLKSHLAIIFDYSGLEVSLFNGGRMLIKNVQNEEEALKTYKEIGKKLNIF
jgi:molybdopterin/thiamine biosynthesis adenylyltransferase